MITSNYRAHLKEFTYDHCLNVCEIKIQELPTSADELHALILFIYNCSPFSAGDIRSLKEGISHYASVSYEDLTTVDNLVKEIADMLYEDICLALDTPEYDDE
jgi:hypothetical protein